VADRTHGLRANANDSRSPRNGCAIDRPAWAPAVRATSLAFSTREVAAAQAD
jgi:hypothetical protein